MFQCFKYSAAKRENYELAQAKVKVTSHFFLRHVESRWTTLEDVVVRLAEQLPTLKDLSDKEKESGRVKTICQILRDKLILAEMYFMKSVLELFSRITRMFQMTEPLIHILYDEMSTLVLQLMRCLTRSYWWQVWQGTLWSWLRQERELVERGQHWWSGKNRTKEVEGLQEDLGCFLFLILWKGKATVLEGYQRVTQDIPSEKFPPAWRTSVTPYRQKCPAVEGSNQASCHTA